MIKTNKWYKHHRKSVLEKETCKLLRDFEIQTDLLISARRPNLIIINKKKRSCRIVDFTVPTDHRIKLKENKKISTSTLLKNWKKLWNVKVTVIPIVIGALGTIPRVSKETRGVENKRTSGDHPNYSIIKIGQNNKESPWDLRILAISLTPVRNHRLRLVWKTRKGV